MSRVAAAVSAPELVVGLCVRAVCVRQVLLLDELTTFLDGEDQRGVLQAVRACVGGPDQVPLIYRHTAVCASHGYPKPHCS